MSHRIVAVAVDPSEYSEKAFDCKYKNVILTILMMRNSILSFLRLCIDHVLVDFRAAITG